MKKVPDIADHFTTKAKNLLTDRNHGVLLTAITLVTELVQINNSCLEEFRSVRFLLNFLWLFYVTVLWQAVPLLVRNLKSLVTTNYSPEHDVSGITDPFLQVKILRLLRLLGKGDEQASETMNDILAQVSSLSYILAMQRQHFTATGCYKHRLIKKCRKLHFIRNCPNGAGN